MKISAPTAIVLNTTPLDLLKEFKVWAEAHRAGFEADEYLFVYQEQTEEANGLAVQNDRYTAEVLLWKMGACDGEIWDMTDDDLPMDDRYQFYFYRLDSPQSLAVALDGFFEAFRETVAGRPKGPRWEYGYGFSKQPIPDAFEGDTQ